MALQPLLTRRGYYAICNAGLFVAAIALDWVAVSSAPPRNLEKEVAFFAPLAVAALIWMALSYRRADTTRVRWLLIAPWITLLSLPLLFIGGVDSDANYEGGGPLLPRVLGGLGMVLVLSWPLATLTLSLMRRRK